MSEEEKENKKKTKTPKQFFGSVEGQLKTAQKLAMAFSPIAATALASGSVAYIGLTVVVDNKHSATFPFLPQVDPESMDEQTQSVVHQARIKSLLLAALEYAKVSATTKKEALASLDEALSG